MSGALAAAIAATYKPAGGGGGADPQIGVSAVASGFGTITTTGVTTTAGSTIYLFASFDAGTFTSITHSQAGTVTLTGAGIDNFGTSVGSRQARIENIAGGSGHTFTLTCSGGGGTLFAVEIKNVAAASFDVSNQVATTTSPFTSASATTTVPTTMLLGGVTGPDGTLFVPDSGNGYTLVLSNDDYWPSAVAARLVTATGAYTSSWTKTGGTAASTQVYVSAFKKA